MDSVVLLNEAPQFIILQRSLQQFTFFIFLDTFAKYLVDNLFGALLAPVRYQYQGVGVQRGLPEEPF